MKNSTIKQAIELGFDFENLDNETTIDEINKELTDFAIENSDKLPVEEDECEVTSSGRSQNVNYGDYTSSGEIVDFSAHWCDAPDTKVYHSDFVAMDKDGEFYLMKLYYLVGETDYNAPDGFYYSEKQKKHIPLEA